MRIVVRPLLRPCLALLVLSACAAPETSSEAASGDNAQRTVITLTPYFGDLRTIPVQIGDWQGHVLLDTGGGFSLVTPSIADSIGCAPVGRLTGFRYTGEQLSSPTCGLRQVGSGEWSRDAELAVFDLMSLLGDAPPIDGLVGLSLFEGSIVTVDLGRNTLAVEAPGWQPPPGAREMRVRASRQAGGAALDLFVQVATPSGPIWLELDSGNIGPALIAPHAAAMLGIADEPSATPVQVSLDIAGLGPTPMSATIRDGIYDGLLSSEFFRNHVVTLDLARIRAWAATSE